MTLTEAGTPATRKGDWIQTFSGLRFWPLDPHPEDIAIKDIAHALSMTCRYRGHSRYFYSVAEHSFLVASQCPMQFALAGLLHDAAEAYICDIPTPLKRNIVGYKEAENAIGEAIAKKFGAQWPQPQVVHQIDKQILVDETNAIFDPPCLWTPPGEPLGVPIHGLPPDRAEEQFLRAFNYLHQPVKELT